MKRNHSCGKLPAAADTAVSFRGGVTWDTTVTELLAAGGQTESDDTTDDQGTLVALYVIVEICYTACFNTSLIVDGK